MMSIIYKETPMAPTVKKYAKEEGDNLVFNVKYENSQLSINDKVIK